MHLVIPDAIGYFYHIQHALVNADSNTIYLSQDLHREVKHWEELCTIMYTQTSYLAEIVQRISINLGRTNPSRLGT